MAAPRSTKLSPAGVRDAFIQDCAACWTAAREKRPRETPYAFIIYGVEDSPHLIPYVLSEEGLNEVAQKYIKDGFYETKAEAAKALRYSVEDAPHFLAETDGVIPTVDGLLAPHRDKLHDEKTLKLITGAAQDALATLDKQGVFGKRAARAGILLGVVIETVDDDVAQRSIKRLNSAAAWKRFQDETRSEGKYRSCKHLAIAPDGKSIYRDGSRANENRKRSSDDEFVSEMVAYDLKGTRLLQRWIVPRSHGGEPMQELAVAPDGKCLYLLHGKYQGESCTTYVTRFACKDGKPNGQVTLDEEPGRLALSADGSRIAVSVGQNLQLLDAQFNVLQSISFEARKFLFMRSGDLLISTDEGVHRLAAGSTKPKLVIPNDAYHLSLDGNEKLLAVSRWFPLGGRNIQKEFGLHLYRLPSMKLAMSFSIENHQLVSGTLSPDGRLLACEASDLASHAPHSIVVFETATGREVARRKGFDFVGNIVFCPDSRTLVLPKSGRMTTEPVVVWKLPER